MRWRSQGRRRSVDRGKNRPGIHPRKSEPSGRRRPRSRRKATSRPSLSQDGRESRAVSDPEHVRTHLRRDPGEPRSARGGGPRAASGSRTTYADDARARAVGQPRSTAEVSEQGRTTGGGGDGGKGAGLRELASAHRAPDTEPGRRVQRVGARYGKSRFERGRHGSQRSCTTSTPRHAWRPRTSH